MEAFEFAANEFWVVRLKEAVPAGNYTLHLEFNGSLVGSFHLIYCEKTRLPGLFCSCEELFLFNKKKKCVLYLQ